MAATTRHSRLILIAALIAAAIAVGLATTQTADAQRPVPRPKTGGPTTVEIAGIASSLNLVGSLTQTIQVIEYQDGDDFHLRKRPGRAQVADFVVTGTGTVPAAIKSWLKDTLEGKLERRDVAINQSGVSLQCHNCFPCGLEIDSKGWRLTLATEQCTMQ